MLSLEEAMNTKFEAAKQALHENMEKIKEMTRKNNEDIVDIDYAVNTAKYEKMLNGITNLGSIVNEQYALNEAPEKKEEIGDAMDDDDDDNEYKEALDAANKENEELMQSMAELKEKLEGSDAKYAQCEKKVIESLSFKWDSSNRWYFEEEEDGDDEKKSDESANVQRCG